MNKRFVKWQGNAATTIVGCAFAGLLIELALCVLISFAIKNGTIPETTTTIAAYILCALGTASATVLTWVIERERKVLFAGLAATIVFVIPLVTALLFWSVDGKMIAISLGCCLIAYFICVWCMSGIGNRGSLSKFKKYYR